MSRVRVKGPALIEIFKNLFLLGDVHIGFFYRSKSRDRKIEDNLVCALGQKVNRYTEPYFMN